MISRSRERAKGGATVALLLLLALLTAGLYFLWFGRTTEAPVDPEAPAPAAPAAAAPREDAAPLAASELPAAPSPPGREDGAKEAGTGSITGSVQVDASLRGKVNGFTILLEEAANVDAEPARGAKLRRFQQSYELTAGQASAAFALHNVPFSGYGWYISASAPDLNGSEEVVPLDAARPSANVVLTLKPAVAVHIVVKDQERQPLPDVPVTLTPVGRPRDRKVLVGMTDAYGLIVHEKAVQGGYELLVGTAQQPLLPRRDVAVGAAGDHYEKVELPRGGDVTFRVLTQAGAPLAEVQVRAIGQDQKMGAPLDLESDKDGRVKMLHLAPGRYHIHFTKKGFKRGYEKVDVELHGKIERNVLLDYDFGR